VDRFDRFGHATRTIHSTLEGFDGQARDLPLREPGVGFGVILASIVDSAGIGASLDFVGDAWL
jgi:hypothetical protein